MTKQLLAVLFAMTVILTMTSIATAADQVPFVATFTSSARGGIPPACAPPLVSESRVGIGNATHLGQFTETQSHCLNPMTMELTNGKFSITGANGDVVSGTYSGHAVITGATTAAIYVTFVITGGTGRFEGATGGGSGTATSDFVTGEANDLLLKGTISRPGSMRQ